MFQAISFQDWTALTLTPQFLIAIGTAWLLSIIIYIVVGACVGYSGQYYKKKFIETGNFWWGFLIFFIIEAILIGGLVVYPFWIKLLG